MSGESVGQKMVQRADSYDDLDRLAGGYISIRPIDLQIDSISELTELLHRAYRKLGEMGLNYRAVSQNDETTLERIDKATCLVAVVNGRIVGTITFYDTSQTQGAPWYDRPEVGHFGQFAVDPELQQNGLGSQLLKRVEKLAVTNGLKELALDTSEQAPHLIEYYEKRGYRFKEYVQWAPLNYRSVIMSKRLKGRAQEK